MRRRSIIVLLALLALCSPRARAQHYVGYNYNNYQTIGGAMFNPATIAGSRFKLDVNLVSISTFAENNGYRFDPLALIGGDRMREDVNFFKLRNNRTRNLWVNSDVLGPSFMVNLGDKGGAIGFSSRARILSNVNNLNNDIFQLFGNASPLKFDKMYRQKNLLMDGHAFADLGVTYARVLFQNRSHVLKGGVTGKYVIGIGAGSVRVNNLKVKVRTDFNNLSEVVEMIESLKGEMSVRYNNSADVAFNSRSSLGDVLNARQNDHGLGLDLGLEYEWYPEGDRVFPDDDGSAWRANRVAPYKLKVGASVTDIGSIAYDMSSNSRVYTINGRNFVSTVLETQPGESLEVFLERLRNNGIISEKEGLRSYRVSLPTTLHLNVDWRVRGRWFLNGGAMFNLVPDHMLGGRYTQHYSLTPRYERRWFSAYSPVSLNANRQFSWGMGFNLGPFFIGSGTVLSNLFSSKVEVADMFMGLHIPIFQRGRRPAKPVEDSGGQ